MKKALALLTATLLAGGVTALTAAPAFADPDPTYPLSVTTTATPPAGSTLYAGDTVTVNVTVANQTDAPIPLYFPTGSDVFFTFDTLSTSNNVETTINAGVTSDFGTVSTVQDTGDGQQLEWSAPAGSELAVGQSIHLTVPYTVTGVIDPTLTTSTSDVQTCLMNATGNDCTASISFPVSNEGCPAVTGLAFSDVTATTATITWIPSPVTVTGYNVEVDDSINPVKNTSSVGTTVSLEDLIPNWKTNVTVSAVCEGGAVSAPANIVVATPIVNANNPTFTGPATVTGEQLRDGFEVTFSGFQSNENVHLVLESQKADGTWEKFAEEATVPVDNYGAGKVGVVAQWDNGDPIYGTNFRLTGSGETSSAVAEYSFATTGDAANNPNNGAANGGSSTPTTPTDAKPKTLPNTGFDSNTFTYIIIVGILAMLAGGGAVMFSRQKMI